MTPRRAPPSYFRFRQTAHTLLPPPPRCPCSLHPTLSLSATRIHMHSRSHLTVLGWLCDPSALRSVSRRKRFKSVHAQDVEGAPAADGATRCVLAVLSCFPIAHHVGLGLAAALSPLIRIRLTAMRAARVSPPCALVLYPWPYASLRSLSALVRLQHALSTSPKPLLRSSGLPSRPPVCIGWAGLAETEAFWQSDFSSRKIISGFMKDSSLGSKRLASMPDRYTNTINTVVSAHFEPMWSSPSPAVYLEFALFR